MTFDEFIAEQGMLSFELKQPVSTMIIVDQCGWADNMTRMFKINQTSQDFLLDQFKNYQKKFDRYPTELKPRNTIMSKLDA